MKEKMKIDNPIANLVVQVDFKLNLWTAIKLRIAGKNYKDVVDAIIENMKKQDE